jgi:hypothetical protein
MVMAQEQIIPQNISNFKGQGSTNFGFWILDFGLTLDFELLTNN